jgi:hypothetical protein
MAADAKPKSDLVIIREFFGMKLPDMKVEVMGENGLSKDEIKEIASGIRDGSLTY